MSTLKSTKALVLAGDGINCEQETAYAAQTAGFATEIVHINDLIQNKVTQDQLKTRYQALFLPGGFSFGDHLGSGRVLGLKITKGLQWDLREFAKNGGVVLGVCNGFQALISMGAFGREVSITHNIQNKFIDRWATLKNSGAANIFLKGLNEMYLPMRHGEGRLLFKDPAKIAESKDFVVAARYSEDVNGSTEQIAGLSACEGRLFGLMPHPEAAVRRTQHPQWTLEPERASEAEIGLQFFKNAYQEVQCL
jgi:phosphoribosylformylglycinamidine (FGAM) synthase-like amidotransferase family enzyme